MKTSSIFLSIIGAIATFAPQAIAQIIPDHTLGQENSIVTPNLIIEGGAIRSNNLLHSFQEFNVNSLQKVYFNQPSNIENIITRITGQNISNINGTLGVLGNGNLFLINPNGIIFGNQAKLDIKGSFVASTSPEIRLGNEIIFSATNPQTPPLLKINVPLGLQLGTPTQNNIINQGNLQVGNNLTFTANNIIINGNLKTQTGDITLKAEDTLKIRDNVNNPVIIQSGKDLRLTGNNKLDIFTLNHPQSNFFSGKDLILTSNNPVGGDGRFNSQGKFRIEKIDQTLGDLSSPNDPVIKASGDVELNSYTGGSLHILAGGSVNIPGGIEINTTDTEDSLNETINLTDGTTINLNGNTQPTLDIRAGIDWQKLGETPTDTGNNPSGANINLGNIVINQPEGLVFLSNQYYPNTKLSSGDINFQSIVTRSDTGNSGSVIIDSRHDIIMNNAQIDTKSYFDLPNSNYSDYKSGNVLLIAQGDITMNNSKIETDDTLGLNVPKLEKSGNINIKSRELSLINSQLNSTFYGYPGNPYGAGDIKIDVQNKITLDNSGVGSLGESGGNPNDIIEIKARELELKNNSKIVLPTTNGSSESGLIALKTETLTLTNNSIIETTSTFGFAGNINIETGNLTVSDSSQIQSNFAGLTKGAAGNIMIKADNVTVEKNSLIAAESSLTLAPEGYINDDVGSLTMKGRNHPKIETLTVSDNSSISTRVYDGIPFVDYPMDDLYTDYKPNAFGGKINIDVSNLILENHSHIQANGDVKKQVLAQNIIGSLPSGEPIFGPVFVYGTLEEMCNCTIIDNAGEININANNISLSNFGIIKASTNSGTGGQVSLNVSNQVKLDNHSKILAETNSGTGGNLKLDNLQTLAVSNNSEISSSTNSGQGGLLLINAAKYVTISDNSLLLVGAFSTGTGGFLEINTADLRLENAVISGSTISGLGGDIKLQGLQNLTVINSNINAGTVSGVAGNINIDVKDKFYLTDNSRLSVQSINGGKSGNLIINTGELHIDNYAEITSALNGINPDVIGSGGYIDINAQNVFLDNHGQITASTKTQGNAGTINIIANDFTMNNGAQILTNTNSGGNAGDIKLKVSDRINISGKDTGLFANTTSESTGNSGNILIDPPLITISDGAGISVASQGLGLGGKLVIIADNLWLDKNAFLSAATNRSDGGNISLKINNLLLMQNDSLISAKAGGTGNGGNLDITTQFLAADITNNDIIASAIKGRGGNILIVTEGIFGIEYRPKLTPQSDINASSEFGVNGFVDIQTPGIDPAQGLVNLPTEVINLDSLTKQSCSRNNIAKNRFTITGRGGIPSDPFNPSDSNISVIDWGNLNQGQTQIRKFNQKEENYSVQPLIEAMGIIITKNGTIALTTNLPNVSSYLAWPSHINCKSQD